MNALLRILGISVGLFAGTAWAQVTNGTISGTVKDSTGAVLPGARITVLNEDTGISRTVQSESSGRYAAPALTLGNYRVTVSVEGFQTEVRRGIVLTVGREAIVDLALSVGAVTQTVEVTAEAPLVQSTTSSLGSLVDDRTIRALPLNGRSYDQLALLQPGVILTAPGGDRTGNFAWGSGKRFSVGGSRPNTNSFLLDGTDINDKANSTPGGAAGTNLGVDTIREFKILTNGFSAEYGRASGAVVTAVTKGGTNEIHGSAFEYLRNSALDARNFFDINRSSPPPFRRNQFGGTVGGPLRRDRTFFFGGYEGMRQGLGTTQSSTVPTLAVRQGILPNGSVVPVNPAVVPFMKLWPAPNGRDFGDGTAEFLSAPTIVTDQDNFMIRLDHQLNEKTSLFARYTFDEDSVDSSGSNPNPVGNNPNFATITSSRRQYSTIQANTVLSANALNHAHFAFNRSFQETDSRPTIELGPEYSFIPGRGVGTINIGSLTGTQRTIAGLGTRDPSFFAYNLLEADESFSYVSGKHSIKTGLNVRRIRFNTATNMDQRGTYTFTTFNDLLAGTPSNLSAAAPELSGNRGYRQTLYSIYMQDDVTVNSRLTLNLGFRWEAITDPTEVNGKSSILLSPAATNTTVSDHVFSIGKKNFEPRAGFAWQLGGTGKTALRAGGGIYHNQILPAYYGLSSQLPPFYALLQANRPEFPQGFQKLAASGGLLRLRAVEPHIYTPASYQYNLSIERQISANSVVQLAYAGRTANHLLILKEVNTPIPTTLPDGRKFFPAGAPRRNSSWDSVETLNAESNAVYNGVTITLRRQRATGLQYQVFYSFSKSMDIISGQASVDTGRSASEVLDPEDLQRDRGPSDFDARHNFVFNLTYPLPFQFQSKPLEAILGGWSLSGIGTFNPGLPLTGRLATNVSKDGALLAPDRPDLKPGLSSSRTEGVTAGCGPVPAGQPLGTADRFYDPCVFSLPLAGTYGNLGRNTIAGPGFANIDLSLEKNFRFRESGSVQLRAEFFNIMNHTNFDLPNTQAFSTSGAYSGSAGRVTRTVTSSRQLQFALRVSF